MCDQLVHTDKIKLSADSNFVVDENIYRKEDYIFYDDEILNEYEGEYLWDSGN